ncbi:hypothetical protein ACA910_010734 [Epithemia clementina (nom. ined.)]
MVQRQPLTLSSFLQTRNAKLLGILLTASVFLQFAWITHPILQHNNNDSNNRRAAAVGVGMIHDGGGWRQQTIPVANNVPFGVAVFSSTTSLQRLPATTTRRTENEDGNGQVAAAWSTRGAQNKEAEVKKQEAARRPGDQNVTRQRQQQQQEHQPQKIAHETINRRTKANRNVEKDIKSTLGQNGESFGRPAEFSSESGNKHLKPHRMTKNEMVTRNKQPRQNASINNEISDRSSSGQSNHKSSQLLQFIQQQHLSDKTKEKSPHQKREGNHRNISFAHHQWDPGMSGTTTTTYPLKVKLPIFVASLPKSGTTSIWQYFNCGGHKASHQWIKTVNSTQSIQTGQCIRSNIQVGRPPFLDCGGYDIFTDTGFANYEKRSGSNCFYPSVDALESIYQYYPQATIILIVRNTTTWYRSMKDWGDGSLLDRWRPCNATGFPPFSASARDFKTFYEWHTDNLRKFAALHSSINYIELELESTENGKILEDKVGIPAHCWSKCTPSSKFCKPMASSKQ